MSLNSMPLNSMPLKSITQIIAAPPPHWVGDGFLVSPLFADHAFQNGISPFLMLDYAAPRQFKPSPKPPGVGVHPHKGFETVTIVYDGEVEHRDSAGNSGVIGPGDVQWMTAGRGILHEEFHSREAAKRGGVVSMAQLWVNLRAGDKSAAPGYQDIRNADIPRVQLEGGEARIIAGDHNGVKGPAKTFTRMNVWDIRLRTGGRAELPLFEGDPAILAVFSGAVAVNGEKLVGASHVVMFARGGNRIAIEAKEDSQLLLLSGEPIDEPIAAYGPFVMNTQNEIRQAMEEFRAGAMGVL